MNEPCAPGAGGPALAVECGQCGTQLAPGMLSCPLCGALVHAAELSVIAGAARRCESDGNYAEAREAWQRALALLPTASQQHATITRRIAELSGRSGGGAAARLDPGHPWWRRGAAAGAAVVLFALGKLKFLLLGLSKASTFFSMFAFFGIYWTQFGWPLAAGLVVSLYIHEMGHVAAIRRAGVQAGAPVFIPGLGALVLLRQRIDDPSEDARIGLAGPLWGLGAALAAYGVFLASHAPIWSAIAHLGAILNLFNLIPVWQLDGARGIHPLARSQRWTVAGALGVAYLLTSQWLLLASAALAGYQALQPAPEQGDRPALLKFLLLIVALSALATLPGR